MGVRVQAFPMCMCALYAILAQYNLGNRHHRGAEWTYHSQDLPHAAPQLSAPDPGAEPWWPTVSFCLCKCVIECQVHRTADMRPSGIV